MASPPFYYPEQDSLQTSSGPLIIGSGLTVDYETGTLLATPGGLPSGVTAVTAGTGIFVNANTGVVTVSNTGVLDLQSGSNISITNVGGVFTIGAVIPPQLNGTVTSVGTGAGLTGGPIISSGTICLQESGVTEGSYSLANISVDRYGRVLSASTGCVNQTFCACPPISVTGNGPVIIDICSATVGQRGVVALCNSICSPSQLAAATPFAVQSVCVIANNARICASYAELVATQANTTSNAANTTANTALTQSTDALNQVTTAQNTADTALADALNAQNTANAACALATSAETTANTALTCVGDAVPLACYTQKGAVLGGTGVGFASAVTPAFDGQVLVSCALCSEGMHWVDPSGTIGTVTQVNAGGGLGGGPITSVGTLCVLDTGVTPATYANATITVNSRGQITSATDGSTTAGIPCGIITRNGELIVGTGPNQPVALPPGNTGQILVAAPSEPTGVVWANYINNWYCGTQAICVENCVPDIDLPIEPPQIGTWAHNCLMWRALGGDMWQIRGSLCVTDTTGFTWGCGMYVFPLPTGLCFDTTPGRGQTPYVFQGSFKTSGLTPQYNRRCTMALPNASITAIRGFCNDADGVDRNTMGVVYVPAQVGYCCPTGIPCSCYTFMLNSTRICSTGATTIQNFWYDFTASNCISWDFSFLAAT